LLCSVPVLNEKDEGGRFLGTSSQANKLHVDPSFLLIQNKSAQRGSSADFLLQQTIAKLVFGRQMNVEKLVTHRFPLRTTAAAVESAANPVSESLKWLSIS
jgi:hypothetical protein